MTGIVFASRGFTLNGVTTTLLVLAALGWLLTIAAAVIGHRLGSRLSIDSDGIPYAAGSDSWSRTSLLLVFLGATVGAVGTILAVLAES